MNRIYLDNAATTPISDNVLKVMNEVMKNNFGKLPPRSYAPLDWFQANQWYAN